ncbi:oligosaccharide flippase family protein [Acinetobacter soli]|uniref:oligosaccharide flippase family protein n=1 Tax=Acinetobacter soli TaxID=487316 RepID=UPI003A85FF0E
MLLSKKIVSNSMWMIFEKIISIFGLIFVTSYVAKYIGPTNFGKISLAATIFTFVQTLTWFGNQEILFKRVSKNPRSGLEYLHYTNKIRKLIFIVITFPLLIWFYFYSDFLTFIFGLATAFSTYFIVQDIYIVYNNGVLKSYINALSNILGLFAALVFRYIVVFFNLDIYYLSIPIVLVSFIPFVLKRYYFNRQIELKVRKIKNKKYNKYYLYAGSALVISTLSISLYTQITNLILVGLESTHALGIYSVAITLGMAWSFINQAVITSVLTKIYKEKSNFETYVMIAKLNCIVLLISLIIILFLWLFGEFVINRLYGDSYKGSYYLLLIISFATLFSGLGTISARFIIKQEGYSYISKKMLGMAFASIPIAYGMIFLFGLKGAAYSIFLIEFLSLTIFNYFYQNGIIFKIHLFPFFKKRLMHSEGENNEY